MIGFAIWLGWVLAALAWGLFLGERGRRIDAQRREVGRPVIPPKPAKELKGPGGPDDVTADLAAAREKLIVDCMREMGCSRADAERDVDHMLAQL